MCCSRSATLMAGWSCPVWYGDSVPSQWYRGMSRSRLFSAAEPVWFSSARGQEEHRVSSQVYRRPRAKLNVLNQAWTTHTTTGSLILKGLSLNQSLSFTLTCDWNYKPKKQKNREKKKINVWSNCSVRDTRENVRILGIKIQNGRSKMRVNDGPGPHTGDDEIQFWCCNKNEKKKKKNEGCLFHSKWLKLQLINDQIYYDNIICGWWETSPVGSFNVKTDRLTNGAARGFQHDPLVLSPALFIRRHHLFNPTGSSSSPRGLADSLAVVQSTSGPRQVN